MKNDIKRDKSDSFSAESKTRKSNPTTKSKPVVAQKPVRAAPEKTQAAEEKPPSCKTTPAVLEQDAPFFSRRVWPD